jgi:FkbM family methyltransferase
MEEYRLQYPIGPQSLVLDAGGYHGDFVDWCRTKWGCRVITFEPLFHELLRSRFVNDPRVTVMPFGLGGSTRRCTMRMQADSSGAFASGDDVDVQIEDVATWAEQEGLVEADLFKINIEGGEYELMPRLLDTALIRRIRFLQIQYHSVGAGEEGAAAARQTIRERLTATHREQWCVNDGQWESWERL